MRAHRKMHFFRDSCVTDFCSCKIGIQYILYISSVLEDPKQLRWGQLSSCILVYTAVLRAVVTRALPSPCGPAFGCCLRFAPAPYTYCHGWHVCRFCRSKSLPQKITIFRRTLEWGFNYQLDSNPCVRSLI